MLLDRNFPHIIPIGVDRQKVSADLLKSTRSRETFHIFSGSERVLAPIASLMQLSDRPPEQLRQRPRVSKSINTVVRRDRFLYYLSHGEWF